MNASFPPADLDTQTAVRDEVLARFGTTEDPRLREIMLSLIRHLHAFVGETKITWAEWERAMAFFATAAGVTGPGRNEFIALSDSIGLSMQVLAASQPKPAGATIPTLIGPFFIDDAPVFPAGADIANGASGEPLYVSGRVLDTVGAAGRGRGFERLAVRRSRPLRRAGQFRPGVDVGPRPDRLRSRRTVRVLERDADRLSGADGRGARRTDQRDDEALVAARASAFRDPRPGPPTRW